jgi:choline monooxygenase
MPHKTFDEILDNFDPTRGLEDSRTPPYTWYTDPTFFDHEVERVFQRNWMAVGRTDQVQHPSDYFTGEIAGNPFVVVRAADNKLYAHHNVCRHKGAVVAQEHGSCEFFECPYHGWRYGHLGELKAAPRLGSQKCFETERYGLRPISVDTWGPYVFLDLDGPFGGDGNPRNLHKDIEPLDQYLRDGFGRLKCEPSFSKTYELNCNWKVFADNSLDGGLHVSYIHGETLAGGLESPKLETITSGRTSIQIGKTTGSDERLGDKVMYAFVFPNMFINMYGNMMDVNIIEPISVDRCRVKFDFFFDFDNFEAWEAKRAMRRGVAKSHLIQDEDISICNSTQKGMNSMTWKHGRYSSIYEKAVYDFHVLLWHELRGYQKR